MVYNAMKLFMEINPGLFDECSEHYRENEATAAQTLQTRTAKWATVAEWARQRSDGEIAAIPPLTDLKGQKFNPQSRIDEDPITQDSQKRLDALRLQDENGGSREGRRQRGADGQYQVRLPSMPAHRWSRAEPDFLCSPWKTQPLRSVNVSNATAQAAAPPCQPLLSLDKI